MWQVRCELVTLASTIADTSGAELLQTRCSQVARPVPCSNGKPQVRCTLQCSLHASTPSGLAGLRALIKKDGGSLKTLVDTENVDVLCARCFLAAISACRCCISLALRVHPSPSQHWRVRHVHRLRAVSALISADTARSLCACTVAA